MYSRLSTHLVQWKSAPKGALGKMTEVDEIRAKIHEYRHLLDTCEDPTARQIYLVAQNALVDRLADIALSGPAGPDRRSGKDRRRSATGE